MLDGWVHFKFLAFYLIGLEERNVLASDTKVKRAKQNRLSSERAEFSHIQSFDWISVNREANVKTPIFS